MTIPENSKVALVGIIFRPDGETPWIIQDNRKALKSEYPCTTKADVLNKIAWILDDMDQSKGHT
jgi:hypothetical protein